MKSFFKGLAIGFSCAFLLLGIFFIFRMVGNILEEPEPTEPPKVVIREAKKPEDTEAETQLPKEQPPEESEEENGSGEPEPPQSITLAFAGDVMFSDHYLTAYNAQGIGAFADEEMLGLMQNADLFIFNEEFPFSLQGEAMEDKEYTFRTDPKYVSVFQELGADIVTLANNHALDFGQAAFCDTLDTLAAAEIESIGGGYNLAEASAPAIRTFGGQKIAVFGATRVSPSGSWYAGDNTPGLFQTYDATRLNAAIAEQEEDTFVVVFVHWGIERNETPEDYQRQLAYGYIDAGADLVIGCHPHVLQGFEYYKGAPIVYSLGNYLFGNRDGNTLLLNAILSEEEPLRIELIPCRRSNGVLKRIENPEGLFAHLEGLSFDVSISEDGVLCAPPG